MSPGVSSGSSKLEAVAKPIADQVVAVVAAEKAIEEKALLNKVNEPVATDEQKARTRSEAGVDEQQQRTKQRTESTSANLNSSRDRNHGLVMNEIMNFYGGKN